MKTKLLLSIFLIFGAHVVLAQQTDSVTASGTWTLKQCIDYAWAHNLSVKRSELVVEESKVSMTQSKMAHLPSINGQASYGYSWGRSLDPVSNLFIEQEIQSSNLALQGSLPIINGLNIQNTARQNKRNFQASEFELAKTKNDVALNVALLFINVVFNKEQLDNARFLLTSSQQQLERTKKQVAAGALSRSEELNLEAQVASDELTLVQRENALALSLLQLKQGLQIPAEQPLDVVVPEISLEDLVLSTNRNEIYEVAKQTMPEIKGAELRVEGSYYGVSAAKGGLYPRLSLVGNITTNYSNAHDIRLVPVGDPFPYQIGQIGSDPNGAPVYATNADGSIQTVQSRTPQNYGMRDQFQDNIYRTLGLQLTIPIFNGYQSRASYQRSIITRERARITQTETQNTLRQNVETAYNDALAASKTFNSSLKQVAARDEAFRMTNQRYEIGAANYVDYVVAANELYRAKTDLVRAKYDFIFRKKVLDFYMGKPLDY